MGKAEQTLETVLTQLRESPTSSNTLVADDDGGELKTLPSGSVVRRDWTPEKPKPEIDRVSRATFD